VKQLVVENVFQKKCNTIIDRVTPVSVFVVILVGMPTVQNQVCRAVKRPAAMNALNSIHLKHLKDELAQ